MKLFLALQTFAVVALHSDAPSKKRKRSEDSAPDVIVSQFSEVLEKTVRFENYSSTMANLEPDVRHTVHLGKFHDEYDFYLNYYPRGKKTAVDHTLEYVAAFVWCVGPTQLNFSLSVSIETDNYQYWHAAKPHYTHQCAMGDKQESTIGWNDLIKQSGLQDAQTVLMKIDITTTDFSPIQNKPHSATFLQARDRMRMFQCHQNYAQLLTLEGEGCADCTIEAETCISGHTTVHGLKFHSQVLFCQAPVLYAACTKPFKEGLTKSLRISNYVRKETLGMLRNFLYTGSFFTEETEIKPYLISLVMSEIIDIAHVYQIKDALKAATENLITSMTTLDCVKAWKQAVLYELDDLRDAALQIIKDNKNTKDFNKIREHISKELTSDQVIDILQST